MSISQEEIAGSLTIEVILKRDIDGAEHTEAGRLAPFGIRAAKKDHSTLLFNGCSIMENNPSVVDGNAEHTKYSVTIRYSLP